MTYNQIPMKNISTPSVLVGILIGVISCGAVGVAKKDFFEYRETHIENNEQKSFDAVFLEDMIPHHEGAIEMSEAVLNDLQNEEVKQLAEDIITAQKKEIELMKTWYKKWFFSDVSEKYPLTNTMGEHAHHMGVMSGDVNNLTKAENPDKEFLEQMIPHHEMAVMMTQMLLKVSTRQEMIDFAESIITVQNAEIAQMKNLLKKIN